MVVEDPVSRRGKGTELLRFLAARGVRVRLVSSAAAGPAPGHGGSSQSTNEVLMVAPKAFASNEEAAADNHFMAEGAAGGESLREAVLAEHAALRAELAGRAGVEVRLYGHGPETPDAVFPNNWFSTHAAAGGTPSTLVLYPMKCHNRRLERREEIVSALRPNYERVVDLTPAEREDPPRYLEGTGSLVLDHERRVAYVAVSERSDEGLARRWAEEMGGWDVVAFVATDGEGRPIYHTNVVMAVGSGAAVVCDEAVPDVAQREELLRRLGEGGREVVRITRAQMGDFCGNVIELTNSRGQPVLALSTRAHDAFTPAQRAALRRHFAELHHVPLTNLERVGGGGVRCTIAEIHPAGRARA